MDYFYLKLIKIPQMLYCLNNTAFHGMFQSEIWATCVKGWSH